MKTQAETTALHGKLSFYGPFSTGRNKWRCTVGDDNGTVAFCDSQSKAESEVMAREIVKRCNLHAEIVETLEALLRVAQVGEFAGKSLYGSQPCKDARALLERAKV